MNNSAEVFLWGTRVGIVHQSLQNPYVSFEYDRDFIKSGIELSPLKMPLSDVVYEFPLLSGAPFFGLPGLIADSLPDNFGNAVIERWLLQNGKSIADFSAIDRLCYTGKRGMGALEYVPAIHNINDRNENINVNEMIKFASEILSKRKKMIFSSKEHLSYSQLLQIGSSAGGARAKGLIAWNEKTNEIKSGQVDLENGFDYWIMKFDNVTKNGDYGLEDSPEYTLIEYAYYKMAIDCGIKMSECRLYKSDGCNHFITKRFDRVDGKKIHMQSLGALAHISYKEPCLCSYEQVVSYMREMGLSQKDVEQFYIRMVFNCFAVNQDDHVKNISFLMDRSGKWSLSPAYDITFAYQPGNRWLSAHQMTVNGKNSNLEVSDFLSAGKKMELKESFCKSVIDKVGTVVKKFYDYAENLGIREQTAKYIYNVITGSEQVRY